MSGAFRRALATLAVTAGVLLLPGVAGAHPLGNFTVNTSAAIVLSPSGIRVEYVVDLAEIPTVQAMGQLDADADGEVSAAERAGWASSRARELEDGLAVEVDGRRLALEVASATAQLEPGQGGLQVLRLEAAFVAATTPAGELTFADGNFAGRVGWREVFATGSDGTSIERSSVPSASPSGVLRAYPVDLLSSPLDTREARLSFAPGASAPEPAVAGAPAPRPERSGGALAGAVGRTGPLMLLALALAFGVGALHALGPGHGKTLMAAYLVGAGGRVRQAAAVGGAIAVMHTASVLALGLVVLSATEAFAPERVYPVLGVASGLAALLLGAALLVSRLGAWGEHRRGGPPGHGDHEHGHGPSDEAHGHEHPHRPADTVLSRRGLLGLAVAGGILPSPTALVVLLASVALHRVAYGLALIGAFSLGLAAALVAVGVLALRARDVVARRLSGRLVHVMPIASAATIALVGLVLTVGGVSRL